MPPIAEIIPRVRDLWLNEAVPSWKRLVAAFPAVPDSDPRRAIAFLIKGVASSTFVSLMLLEEHLSAPEWWEAHGFPIPRPLPPIPNELNAYNWGVTAGFVVFPFVHYETGLRRIVRAIDPSACAGGAAEFKSIYDWLLARLAKSGWSWPDGTQFLDLYRSVRNTIHNTGIYFHPQRANQTIMWKGCKYDFETGKPISFMDWDFDLAMVSELIRLNEATMTCPIVAALPSIL